MLALLISPLAQPTHAAANTPERLLSTPVADAAAAFAQIGELQRERPGDPKLDALRLQALRWFLESLEAGPVQRPRTLRELMTAKQPGATVDAAPVALWQARFLRVVDLRILESPGRLPSGSGVGRPVQRLSPFLFVSGAAAQARLHLLLELVNRAPVPISLPDFVLDVSDESTRIQLLCEEWPQAPSAEPGLRPAPTRVVPGRGVGYICTASGNWQVAAARLRDASSLCAAGNCRPKAPHFESTASQRALLDAIASAEPSALPEAAAPAAAPAEPVVPRMGVKIGVLEGAVLALMVIFVIYLQAWWWADLREEPISFKRLTADILRTAFACGVGVGAFVLALWLGIPSEAGSMIDMAIWIGKAGLAFFVASILTFLLLNRSNRPGAR